VNVESISIEAIRTCYGCYTHLYCKKLHIAYVLCASFYDRLHIHQ